MTLREQQLGLGFAVVLLVGGAFVGFKQLQAWKQRVDVRSMTVEAKRAEAEDLLLTKAIWEQRSEWLGEKQPVYSKRSDADLLLLNLVRDSAAKFDVPLHQTQLMEPIERAGLTSANMLVGAKGDFKAMMKWLHSIQEPNAFVSVSSITMLPDEQDTSRVDVTMNIQKWFRLPPL